MAGLQIQLDSKALLRQTNKLQQREIDLLREQVRVAEEMVPDAPDEHLDCDLRSLEQRREYLEYRSGVELEANRKLHDKQQAHRFQCEGLSVMLCHLQQLQKLKLDLAEAELACVISQIWACKTRCSEDSYEQILCKINSELEGCPEQINPFVADCINNTLKDC